MTHKDDKYNTKNDAAQFPVWSKPNYKKNGENENYDIFFERYEDMTKIPKNVSNFPSNNFISSYSTNSEEEKSK